MKKLIIIISIIGIHLTYPAALIPPEITSHVSKITVQKTVQLLGKQNAELLINYAKIGDSWATWYLRSFTNPSLNELKQNALFCSIESGTTQSITSDSPYFSAYKNYFMPCALAFKKSLLN